jgi:membrane protein
MGGPAHDAEIDGRVTSPRATEKPAKEAAVPEVLRALRREILSDHTLLVAAGLAYYAVFGLLPALAAAAAIWGRFGDLSALKRSLQHGGGMLPDASIQMLDEFVTSVPEGFGAGIALLANLLLVTWTAYRAASGLLAALNVVYDVDETRGRSRRAAVALAVGVSGIALLFVALAALALVPLLANWLKSETAIQLLWLRWPTMAALFLFGLNLLFRYAPNRDHVHPGPVGWGALVAALLCVLASAGVSLYVAHVGSFGKLYGSLGSIVVLLLWLYVSALALLTGAEIDALLSARMEGTQPHTRDGTPGRAGDPGGTTDGAGNAQARDHGPSSVGRSRTPST